MFPSAVKTRWASPIDTQKGNPNATNNTLPLAKITGMYHLGSTNMSSLKKTIYNASKYGQNLGLDATSGTFSPKGSLFQTISNQSGVVLVNPSANAV
jgi:hypothetical protein